MNVSFIGYGQFAKAFVSGLKKNPSRIVVSSPSLAAGMDANGIKTESDNRIAIQNAHLIILAVKPAQVNQVMEQIGPLLPTDCVLISVVTGIQISHLSAFCSKHPTIVRAMPNTPIAVQKGCIGLYGTVLLTPLIKKQITELFSELGVCHWVEKECDLDRLTALSGSGPAYVFLFLEALVSAGIKIGLSEELATAVAIETVIGSTALAQTTPERLRSLREQVTSPGGTTQAALQQLQAGDFSGLIEAAVQAAFDRAKELGQNN